MGLSRGSQGAPGRIVGGSGMSWGLWAAPGGPWGGLGLHPPPAGSLMPRPPCSCAVMTEFARLQLQPKGIRGRYHPRVPVPWASHPPDSALPRVPPSFPVVLPGEEKTDTGGPQTPENDNGDGDTVPAPDGPEAPRTAKPGEVCEVLGGGGWEGAAGTGSCHAPSVPGRGLCPTGPPPSTCRQHPLPAGRAAGPGGAGSLRASLHPLRQGGAGAAGRGGQRLLSPGGGVDEPQRGLQRGRGPGGPPHG